MVGTLVLWAQTISGKYQEGCQMSDPKPVVRCAIYTRKSSEEGLEQSFNSLDAQREACEAFILSQRRKAGGHFRASTTTEAIPEGH